MICQLDCEKYENYAVHEHMVGAKYHSTEAEEAMVDTV